MLISELGKYPPDTEIVIEVGNIGCDVEEIFLRDGKLVLR
jgi:hypothetical protein